MKNRTRKLIILAAAVAVLVGVYFAVRAVVSRTGEDGPGDDSRASYTVAGLDSESLASLKLRVRSGDGESVSVTEMEFRVRDDKTGFEWTADPEVPLDNTKFVDIVTALNDTMSGTRMTDLTADELRLYGVDDPAITATFTFSGGRTYTCGVGSLNAFNGRYYFTTTDDPGAVYMVGSDVRDALDVSIYDVLSFDELPEIGTSSVRKITWEKDGRKLEYTYYPSGNSADYTTGYNWYLSVDGAPAFAVDKGFGTDIEQAVSERMLLEAVAYDNSRDAEYGLDAPGTLRIDYIVSEEITDSETSAGSTVTREASYVLQLGGVDEEGCIYVRTPDSRTVYLISHSDAFAQMTDPDEDLVRPGEIISPEISRIDSITFSGGGKTLAVELTHVDGTTTYRLADGSALDYEKYSALMDALTALSATSFTSVLEADPSVPQDVEFSVAFRFNAGDVSEAVLEIRGYTESYRRAVFMGRDSQLITAEAARGLSELLEAYFAPAESGT